MRTLLFAIVVSCGVLSAWAMPGVTKNEYLDLVEAAVGAYTTEHMQDYHARVQREGIREHGFPRLAANLGVLIANGRRPNDKELFRGLMTTACLQMSTALEASKRQKKGGFGVGNDFTVKEIVLCLLAIEKSGVFPKSVTEAWRADIRKVVPEKTYNCQPKLGSSIAHNWAVFGATSEQLRNFAGLGGSADYTERYFSDQLRFFDMNGMYKDPHQPMVYDFVTRLQFMLALSYGYKGPSRAALEANFLKSAEPSLLMQSISGELPYGGRSNQFLHSETHYAAVCEWYATWFKQRGDLQMASRFRRAAKRAVESLQYWLKQPNYRHIKNRFPLETRQGCEGYGYFDKYMVTMGSWAWLGCLFADESIPAADTAPAATAFQTSPDFHRTFLTAGDYGLELDTNCDTPYDANGVGRIQRYGAPPMLALSVPFPDGSKKKPNYVTGVTNATPLAILPGWKKDGDWQYAYQACYEVKDARVQGDRSRALVEIARVGLKPLTWTLEVAPDGVSMELAGTPGEELALTIPVFDFDGESHTEIRVQRQNLSVCFNGWSSCVSTSGEFVNTKMRYGNRNGYSIRYEARDANRLKVAFRIVPK